MPNRSDRPIPSSNLFPYAMRRLRRMRGMTLTMLAEQMGVTLTMVSYLEKGQRVPNRNLLRRMTVAMTLTPHEAADLYLAANILPPGQYTVDDDGTVIQTEKVG